MTEEKIISVSRRTDVPAFYSEWFINRVRAGFCHYPNPLYPSKQYRVSLRKEDVLGFVFWTRHAAPLIPYLDELDEGGFTYYFQYTIVGYPRTIDPGSPSVEGAMETLLALSDRVGPGRVIWRYDPVLLNDQITEGWHIDNFAKILGVIGKAANRVVISVIDPYQKTKRRTSGNGVLYDPSRYTRLLSRIVDLAGSEGVQVESCAESAMSVVGISQGSCVDAVLLKKLRGRVASKPKFHQQRPGCLCHRSIDIGVNNSCGFGCQYCYATADHAKAQESLQSHNPAWSAINQDYQAETMIPQQASLF